MFNYAGTQREHNNKWNFNCPNAFRTYEDVRFNCLYAALSEKVDCSQFVYTYVHSKSIRIFPST